MPSNRFRPFRHTEELENRRVVQISNYGWGIANQLCRGELQMSKNKILVITLTLILAALAGMSFSSARTGRSIRIAASAVWGS
jgi:hypothetical protein